MFFLSWSFLLEPDFLLYLCVVCMCSCVLICACMLVCVCRPEIGFGVRMKNQSFPIVFFEMRVCHLL